MSTINVPGRAALHRVRSTSPRTGRETTFITISGRQAVSFKLTATKGYRKLYEPLPDGTSRFREAACWAHWRRDFHYIWTSNKSEIARVVLDHIGALYDVERDIAGQPAAIRLAARQKHSKAKVEALRVWAEAQLTASQENAIWREPSVTA